MAQSKPLVVKVETAYDFTSQAKLEKDHLPVYHTLSKQRGVVKIINVESILEIVRKGSLIDVDNLKSLFSQMGFDVDVHPTTDTSHTKEGIIKGLEEFVGDHRLKKADIAILFIMSHGDRKDGRDYFWSADNQPIFIDEVKNYFSNSWCKFMRNKPKLIFLQTCRGKHVDYGYPSVAPASLEVDGNCSLEKKIPKCTDLLVAYATTPDHVAFRRPNVGSWFIYTLCNEFMRNAYKRDVATMLTSIYWQMKNKKEVANGTQMYQTGEFTSTAFAHCFLNPGVYRDDRGIYRSIATDETIQNVVTTPDEDKPLINTVPYNCQELKPSKTNLHLAAEEGNIDKCNQLILEKVDIDPKDNDGCTPLHLAAQNDHVDCCKVLLNAKAMHFETTKNGDSPLHLAAANGCKDVCTLLLEEGATVDSFNGDKNTPLHVAAKNGHKEICKLLLNAEAKFHLKNTLKETPLHLAASNNHNECCLELIISGADIEAVDVNGNSAMHQAATNGHGKSCNVMYTKGAQLNATNLKNQTPLHLASCNGHLNCCQVLIKLGAQIDATDKNQCTPLGYAADNGHWKCCEELKKGKADINAVDIMKNSALHRAAKNGRYECCLLFISYGLDIQQKNRNGCTPLHLAAANGHLECCKRLVDKGASIDVKNNKNKTPLDCALENNKQQCIDFFRSTLFQTS